MGIRFNVRRQVWQEQVGARWYDMGPLAAPFTARLDKIQLGYNGPDDAAGISPLPAPPPPPVPAQESVAYDAVAARNRDLASGRFAATRGMARPAAPVAPITPNPFSFASPWTPGATQPAGGDLQMPSPYGFAPTWQPSWSIPTPQPPRAPSPFRFEDDPALPPIFPITPGSGGGGTGGPLTTSPPAPGAAPGGTGGSRRGGFFSRTQLWRGAWVGAGLAAAGGLHEAGAAADQTAGMTAAFVEGAGSLSGKAFATGAAVGASILEGVLSLLGPSGKAVGHLGGTVLNAAGGIGQTLVGAGTNLVGAGIRGAGAVISGVANTGAALAGGAGYLIGAGGAAAAAAGMLSGPGMVIGLVVAALAGIAGVILSGIGSLISAVVQAITSAIKEIFSALGELVGEFGKVATAAFQTLIEVLKDVAETVGKVYSAATLFDARTGSGFGTAMRAGTAFSPFGITGQQVQSMFGGGPLSPWIAGMRANMAGLPNPVTDPQGFLAAGAANYGNLRGNPMKQSMLGNNVFDAFAPVWAMGPQRVAQVAALGAKYAPDPGQIQKMGADLAQAGALFALFGERIKLIFAQSLIPLVNTVLPWLLNLVSTNSAKIISAVQGAGTWLFTQFPALVLHGLATLMRGAASFLSHFSDFTKYLHDNLFEILTNLDAFLNGMRGLVIGFASIGAYVASLASQFADLMKNPWRLAAAALNPTFILGGIAINALKAGASTAATLSQIPLSNLAGAFGSPTGTLSRNLSATSRAAAGYATTLSGYADTLDKTATTVQTAALDAIKNNTGKTADLLADTKESIADTLAQMSRTLNIVARVLAYQGEDEAANLTGLSYGQ